MALKLSKKTTKVQKIKKKIVTTKQSHVTAGSTRSSKLSYPTGEYFEAVGRRKVATARVRLYRSQGDFIVNDKLVGEYFNTIPNAHGIYNKPFEMTNTLGTFTFTAKISGSGPSAQLDAMVHAISRALIKFDPENKLQLKPTGLLTRDDRMKETRKIGHGGKARTKRQSPKR